MTPIRDSLNRLAGERLVHASRGEGYQVPLLDETEFRALLDWHAVLIGMALGAESANATATQVPKGHDGIGERTAVLFGAIASAAESLELDWALGNAAARLGRHRRQPAYPRTALLSVGARTPASRYA